MPADSPSFTDLCQNTGEAAAAYLAVLALTTKAVCELTLPAPVFTLLTQEEARLRQVWEQASRAQQARFDAEAAAFNRRLAEFDEQYQTQQRAIGQLQTA